MIVDLVVAEHTEDDSFLCWVFLVLERVNIEYQNPHRWRLRTLIRNLSFLVLFQFTIIAGLAPEKRQMLKVK